MMTIEERLENMEREVERQKRRNRWLLGAILLLVGGLVAAGAFKTTVNSAQAQGAGAAKEIRARSILIEDEKGQPRAALAVGKVGINDNAPAEYLDVNGNINVTGVYKVADSQIAQKDIAGLTTTDGPTFDHIHFGTSQALVNIVDSLNVGAGFPARTSGNYNNSFGVRSQEALTAGVGNNAFGYQAQVLLTTGNQNNAFGRLAHSELTEGSYNTAFGDDACDQLKTGSYNTALGFMAGWSNISADNGLFLGTYAGYYEMAADKLFVDNRLRASQADGRVKALIYGIFADATADQKLYLNSEVYIAQNLDVTGVYKVGGSQIAQKDIVGLTTADSPTFDHLHITNDVGAATVTVTDDIKSGDASAYGGKLGFAIADDNVYSFTPSSAIGIFCLSCSTTGNAAIVAYRAGASNYTVLLAGGANVAVTTGVLTGTTGTDGKLTISTHTDGKIYIENRVGASRSLSFMIIAKYY